MSDSSFGEVLRVEEATGESRTEGGTAAAAENYRRRERGEDGLSLSVDISGGCQSPWHKSTALIHLRGAVLSSPTRALHCTALHCTALLLHLLLRLLLLPLYSVIPRSLVPSRWGCHSPHYRSQSVGEVDAQPLSIVSSMVRTLSFGRL